MIHSSRALGSPGAAMTEACVPCLKTKPCFVFKYSFISFILALMGFHWSTGFSLVAESGDCSSLQRTSCSLVAVASLVVECRLQGTQASVIAAPGLQSTGSAVVGLRLSRSRARGISQIRDGVCVSCVGRRTITEPPGKPLEPSFFLLHCSQEHD